MQSDKENLFTIVMAGQLELARRLEHPKRANLFQRIGVYCHLNKIESCDLMRDYIEHRLERAGTTNRIFTDAAYHAIWEVSEYGVPRLVNRIAKLALKAGQTHGVRLVDDTIVCQIGSRFSRMSAAIQQERRERMRETLPAVRPLEVASTVKGEERSAAPATSFNPLVPAERSSLVSEETENGGEALTREPSTDGVQAGQEGTKEADPSRDATAANAQVKQSGMPEVIKLPDHIYAKARKLSMEQRLEFAGKLAAEVLKKYPHLIQQLGNAHDPVPAWSILRSVVMRQIEQRQAGKAAQAGSSR